ncbi:MAG TPA: YncE family protein [Arachnia sp.]|nr:YncE family protein [Arachnia sp.]
MIVIALSLISTALRSLPSAFQGVTPPQPTAVAIPQTTPQTSSSSSETPVGASIAVTERPHQVAIDSEGRRLFVTNRDASSITVVDLATETTLATWPVERQPLGVAFDPVENTLWVTNYNDASVTVLTPEGEHIDSFPVGRGPEGIALDEVHRRAYVVNTLDRSVSVVDLSTRSVHRTQELGYSASGIAVDTVQGRVCMVQPQALRMLYCYDEDFKLAVMLGSVGDLVAIDPVRHDRYGVRLGQQGLSAVNAVTEEKVTLALGHVPAGIAVDPATRLVYVTLPDAQEIRVLSPLP